jgi:putative phosphoesterase
VIRLIDALDAYQKPLYPPESHHGIDIDALRRPEVLFAVARDDTGAALGCGAIVLGAEFGELKRMFVAPQARGRGIGRDLLAFLEDEAAARGCTHLVLETGIHQGEALGLYERAGYLRCGPFGHYADDPFSVFMHRHVPRMPSLRIGLISDTHDLLRPEAAAFLAGCDRIVHAGDICDPMTLDAVARIAPVTAVRGNNDRGDWAARLRETELVQFGDVYLYAIHDLAQLDIDPSGAQVRVVVSGHSHRPSIEERDGVLFVNPGSAGPRRFTLPISAGELIVRGASVSARTVELVTSERPAR